MEIMGKLVHLAWRLILTCKTWEIYYTWLGSKCKNGKIITFALEVNLNIQKMETFLHSSSEDGKIITFDLEVNFNMQKMVKST